MAPHTKIFKFNITSRRRRRRRRRGRPGKRWKEEVGRYLQVLGVRRWRDFELVFPYIVIQC